MTRHRRFPHVDGDFATTVYLQIPPCISTDLRLAAIQCRCALLLLQLQAAEAEVRGGVFMSRYIARNSTASNGRVSSNHCLPFVSQELEELEVALESLEDARGVFGASPPKRSGSCSQPPGGGNRLGLHVSLSRVVTLRLHFIESFLERLKRAVEDTGVGSFDLVLRGLRVFGNEDGTRFFAALMVDPLASASQATALFDATEKVTSSFGLGGYFKPRLPHVSLAWTCRDLSAALPPLVSPTSAWDFERLLASLDVAGLLSRGGVEEGVARLVEQAVSQSDVCVVVRIRDVRVSVGQRITKIGLKREDCEDSSDEEEEEDDEDED